MLANWLAGLVDGQIETVFLEYQNAKFSDYLGHSWIPGIFPFLYSRNLENFSHVLSHGSRITKEDALFRFSKWEGCLWFEPFSLRFLADWCLQYSQTLGQNKSNYCYRSCLCYVRVLRVEYFQPKTWWYSRNRYSSAKTKK